jgi:orotate phosphoribosyltransferase
MYRGGGAAVPPPVQAFSRLVGFVLSCRTGGHPVQSRQRLAELLARYAYEEGKFTLSSGGESDFYLDAKVLTYDHRAVRLVGQAVLDIAREYGVQAIGGLTMGADAIVVSAVWASLQSGVPLSGFIVRKERKAHGKSKWIEGVHPGGKRVAIVDDVITKGGSVLKAVEEVRKEGATVEVVIGLIDREEGGAAAVQEAGVPFRAVCTLSDIRAHVPSGARA